MKSSLYNTYYELLTKEGFPSFLNKYLQTPSIKRLKDIGYFCGMDYASKSVYNFKELISRYDHCLSVALLTWAITKDKVQTIAGLYHDAATPCFSHVIDYMNKDYSLQESTEAYTKEILLKDKKLQTCLKQDNIYLKDIINFKKYPIVDNKRPKLCADRLDGLILTGIAWTKSLTKKDIISIINDISVYKNEDGEQEIGFKTKSIAEKVLKTSNEIDVYCHSNEDNYMMELLANITRIAISNNIATYNELYFLTEPELIKRIKNSNNKELKSLMSKFETINIKDIPITKIDNIKVRNLDPLVLGKRLKSLENK